MRKKALDSGNLKTTEQQKVTQDSEVIVIESTKTEVVYVPSYSPTVVYGPSWSYPYYYYPPPGEPPETTKRIYAHYEVSHLREAFDRFSASPDELAAVASGKRPGQ